MRRKLTDTLIQWKKNPQPKPLIIQGGRHTGKTWLLRDFGSRQYETTIYINLETDRPVAEYLSSPHEAQEALLFLETYSGKPLKPSNTLLILDNIQCTPQITSLLSSISLDYPGYHITAAERGFLGKYDSGDVDVLALYPLDFEEFLWANSEFGLAKEIRNSFSDMAPLDRRLHEKALSQFRLYEVTGGIPRVILEYRKEKKLLTVPDIQQKILELYYGDISSRSPLGLSRYCRNSWMSIPSQLGKRNSKFQYRHIAKGGTARIYQDPINWLIDSGFAYRSFRRFNLSDNQDINSFNLYYPDIGLTARGLGIPAYILLTGEETPASAGCAESYLAQTFIQNGFTLSYWTSGNQSSVPFLLEKSGQYIAVDFRLTPHQKTRSLSRLHEICPPEKMYLVSVENFKRKELYDIVPFYAAFCI